MPRDGFLLEIALLALALFAALALWGTVRRRAAERAQRRFDEQVAAYLPVLRRKQRQLVRVDDYGLVDRSRWEREVGYFLDRVVLEALAEREARHVREGLGRYRERRVVGKAEQLLGSDAEPSPNPVERAAFNRGDQPRGRRLGAQAALRGTLLRPRRDGEPHQGVSARPAAPAARLQPCKGRCPWTSTGSRSHLRRIGEYPPTRPRRTNAPAKTRRGEKSGLPRAART